MKTNEWEERALRAEEVAVLALKHMEQTLKVYGEEQLALIDRAVAAEAVVEAARRLMKRSAKIDEKHPAYGFLVMGIPLAKAVAEYDAKREKRLRSAEGEGQGQ
jgi:hypothetical protein